MSQITQINQEILESIREVGNIGSGNAASKLGELMNKKCLIDIPEVNDLDFNGIKQKYDIENCFAVSIEIKIMGDIPALVLVLSKKASAGVMAGYISGIPNQIRSKDFNFSAQFALKRMGEMVTRAFSESVCQFLQVKARFTMPTVVIDTWSNSLENAIVKLKDQGDHKEKKLVISCNFFDPDKTFEGIFLYVLNQESKDVLINRIGILMSGDE